MPIQNGRYVSPTWVNNGPPAIDQTELQAITDTLAELGSGASGSGNGKRYASLVIGTSTNGWTTEDCDYLCDGVSDDVEFNSAIDAISSDGGEIIVLAGTYFLSNPLSLLSNTSISGSGPVTIKRQTTGGSGALKYLVSMQFGTLSGITFDGNATIFQGSQTNIYEVAAGPSCIIKNCTFSNFVYGAVYSAGATYFPPQVIENNIFAGSSSSIEDVGIYIDATQNISILQNTFLSISTSIQSSPSGAGSGKFIKQVFVKDNYTPDITGENIILDGTARSIVSGNICGSIQILNTSGLRLSGVSNIISDNIISTGSGGQNLIVLGASTSYNLVTNNNLAYNNVLGNIEDNGTNNTISNNIASTP